MERFEKWEDHQGARSNGSGTHPRTRIRERGRKSRGGGGNQDFRKSVGCNCMAGAAPLVTEPLSSTKSLLANGNKEPFFSHCLAQISWSEALSIESIAGARDLAAHVCMSIVSGHGPLHQRHLVLGAGSIFPLA